MNIPHGQYQVKEANFTIAQSATGDVFQLRNGSTRRVEILEIRMGQTTLTDLEQLAIALNRGSGGAGGSALTERAFLSTMPTATATAHSDNTDFTTDVGTLDFDYGDVWNILQNYVWLPTPEIKIVLEASDHFAIALDTGPSAAISLTVNVIWREF